MSDEKKPFTVTDRRHFTADGTPRSEGESSGGAEPGRAPVLRGQVAGGAGTEPGVDFAGFVLSLGAQAGLLLEGGVSPEDGQAIPPDLAGARQMIGILEMLRDKTEGRRTPEETRVLESLLYQLRMGYLARAGVVDA